MGGGSRADEVTTLGQPAEDRKARCRRPEAVEALSRALELAPGSRELRTELAELLEACECWPELLERLEQEAREASRSERAQILERGATIAWDRISPDAALPWLERLRRERPDDERTTDRIVEAHRRASRGEALLRALADAEEICPDSEIYCAVNERIGVRRTTILV